MKYILIFLFYHMAPSVTSATFNDEPSCRAAAEAMRDALISEHWSHPDIVYRCVPQGQEPPT